MIKLIKFIFFLLIGYACFFFHITNANEKIKIGLLVPMTGENKDIGQSIIKAVSLAVKDINNSKIEIFPKIDDNKQTPTVIDKHAVKLNFPAASIPTVGRADPPLRRTTSPILRIA